MTPFEKRTKAQQAAAVVGVDAGKFEHTLVVRRRGSPDSRAFAFKTTRAGFDSAIHNISKESAAPPPEVLIGIEFAGNYGFTLAHYLDQLGYPVVSVLPSHTKSWKEVVHNQNLKTDAKDAAGITDLVWQGRFVSFPFLEPRYAELRYLVSARERLQTLRKGAISRLRNVLQVVFPEFEKLFPGVTTPTALALLSAYPGPDDVLQASPRRIVKLLRDASRNHRGKGTYDSLCEAARATLALPLAQGFLKAEIALLVERVRLYEQQIVQVERGMAKALDGLPETEPLLSIPPVGPVTAAAFLGAIGNPQSYENGKEILKLAGFTLVEKSSGIHRGEQRISKRGRPGLRAMAYMLAVRGIAKPHGAIFRKEYDAVYARNGGKAHKALIAVARGALRMMFSVARDRRCWTPEAPPKRRPLAEAAQRAMME